MNYINICTNSEHDYYSCEMQEIMKVHLLITSFNPKHDLLNQNFQNYGPPKPLIKLRNVLFQKYFIQNMLSVEEQNTHLIMNHSVT
jgi:hypothetical protein